MAELTGRTVLVTGATGGLGRAAAAAAVAAGARVRLVGRDPDRLADMAAPFGAAVAGTHVHDLAVSGGIQDLMAAVGDDLDAVWHLVGGWRGGQPLTQQPDEDWTWLHSQLAATTAGLARAVATPLRDRPGGRFLTVSSPFATAPTSSNAAYAAAKAASDAVVLALADEWRGDRATANVVVVGQIGGRGVPAEAVASALVTLSSDAGARMSGQRIRLRSGELA